MLTVAVSSAAAKPPMYLEPSFGNHGLVHNTFGGWPRPNTLAFRPPHLDIGPDMIDGQLRRDDCGGRDGEPS